MTRAVPTDMLFPPRVGNAVAGWLEFEESVRERNRFVPDGAYLERVIDGCLKRTTMIPNGREFFRARIIPFDPAGEPTAGLPNDQMMAPKPHQAAAGRLNPEGIPYLYVASDIETAISEVRPWQDARVSVATMHLNSGRTCVDLRDISDIDDTTPLYWAAYMFGRPVHREDTVRYAATQLISEHLKARGLDGIIYQSVTSSSGHNVAFFEPAAASVVETRMALVNDVRMGYTVGPSGRPTL